MEKISWYSRIVAYYPYAIMISAFVFSTTCVFVSLTTKFPDFSDPELGFEARGTPLAQRMTAWSNLMEESLPRGRLTNNPLEYYYFLQEQHEKKVNRNKSSKNISNNRGKKFKKDAKVEKNRHNKSTENDTWYELMKLKSKTLKHNNNDHDKKEENEFKESVREINNIAGMFCNEPSSSYARVVITVESDNQSLWSLNGVLAQCHIDAALRANQKFSSLCELQINSDKKCCRSWSPANYIALLSNRTSCLAVTESDLVKVEKVLQRCYYYYRNFELTPECAEDLRCQRRVPTECYTFNAPYNLLHYLLDTNFIQNDTKSKNEKSLLKSAMIILPIAASAANIEFYDNINIEQLKYKDFYVPAMQLGLKTALFDRLLIVDSRLLIFGFFFVIICIWSYTGSLCITVSTMLTVVFSLGISHAIYSLILNINIFPFMNLLAIVVAVGIGADDAFIFCKVWENNKQKKSLNPNNSLTLLVNETLKHAVPAMFVTTLTTAVAFFASIVSNVTAINCFSLFSGMTVIANFVLMITWFPAMVVIAERCQFSLFTPTNFIIINVIRPAKRFMENITRLFNDFLARAVTLFKWLWFLSFLTIIIIGCFVVFYFPGLQLPDTPDFQLFHSSHVFEQYDLFYSKHFWFEKVEQGDGGEVLPLRFVWGIQPEDNGNYFDPASKGSLVSDDSFDVTSLESQIWLQKFCKSLREQQFYRSTLGPLLPNCFIESLQPWMERPCEDPINPMINRFPCCNKSPFPYQPSVLKQCAAKATAEMHRTPPHLWNYGTSQTAGLKFRKQEDVDIKAVLNSRNDTKIFEKIVPKIEAVVVEYDSIYSYSLSFFEMNKFYTQVETWMQNELATAPPGMKNGWFVSHLEFFELQRTLYEGTMWAIVVSMGLALTVVALVTLNPFVSFYAILAVGGSIIVSVAILILIGWRLNVLESVAVSTAIGLAVDFSLHYGMSYRSYKLPSRTERIKLVILQMGGPTLMAALTSGAAGALMLPSRVLAYIQIGIFLVIIMSVSWIYATFFLCSLLAIVGPTSHFTQFNYPRIQRFAFNSKRTSIPQSSANTENGGSVSSRTNTKDKVPISTLSNAITICQFHYNEPSIPPSPTAILLNSDIGSLTHNEQRKMHIEID